MNSDQIFRVIDQIAHTPSKKEKVEIIKNASSDDMFRKVLVAALDPATTYGIAARPKTIGDNLSHQFDEGTWELIEELATRKLTGNAAIEAVAGEMTALSKESSELFWRIISKDLKGDFGASTVNKAVKGLIREFPYMRCCLPKDAKLDTFSWGLGVFSQEKADGMFGNVDIEDSKVRITSRQGTEFPLTGFGSIIQEFSTMLPNNSESQGEFVVFKNGKALPRAISNGIMNHIADGGSPAEDEEVRYFIWDNIPLSAIKEGKYDVPYHFRWQLLLDRLNNHIGNLSLIDTVVVHSMEQALYHYRIMLKEGKEGTVLKDRTAIWKDGTSKQQVKLKLEADCDLIVKAINPGKEGSKIEGRPGALHCETSDGLLEVDVTIKNEEMRAWVERQPEVWLESIVTVCSNAIVVPSDSNPKHSLFLPRMVEASYRTDKDEADSLQRVFDQFEAAIKAV